MSSEAVCVNRPAGDRSHGSASESPAIMRPRPRIWSGAPNSPRGHRGCSERGGRAGSKQAGQGPELPGHPRHGDRMETRGKRDRDARPGKQLEPGGPGRGTVPGRGMVGPPANAPSHIFPGGSSFSIEHAVVSRASHGCPPQHTAHAQSTAPKMKVSTPDRGASGVQPISHALVQGPCPLLTVQVVSL